MSVAVRCCLVVAALVLAAGAARADMIFTANLTHDQEVPPVADEGASGIATFVLNEAQNALTYDVQLFGLDLDGNQTSDPNDNVTRVHFHSAAVGANGGVVFGIIDGSASLRNDLDDLTLNEAASHITGVWDGAEGNGTTLALQLPNLLAGGVYFNVHTADHAGGEIRGQVLAPEPSAFPLAALAAAAFLVLRLRGARAPRSESAWITPRTTARSRRSTSRSGSRS